MCVNPRGYHDDVRMAEFVLKIEKLSLIGVCGRCPSPIIAPGLNLRGDGEFFYLSKNLMFILNTFSIQKVSVLLLNHKHFHFTDCKVFVSCEKRGDRLTEWTLVRVV